MRLSLARLTLLLYPLAFRRRYGREMSALLEETPAHSSTVLDLARGALAAHLDPPASLARALTTEERLRASASGVLACWVVFAAAGLGFGLTTEDPPFGLAGDHHPLLDGAHGTVQVMAMIASNAILIGALPLIVIALNYARRERSARLAAALPFLAVATFIVLTRVLVLTVGRSPRATPAGGLEFLAWALIGLTCAAVCVLASRRVLFAMPVARRWLLAAFACATVVTAAMLAITLATALYTVALSIDASALAGAPNGPMQLTNVGTSLVLQLLMMAAAGTLAMTTTRRGWHALRSEPRSA